MHELPAAYASRWLSPRAGCRQLTARIVPVPVAPEIVGPPVALLIVTVKVLLLAGGELGINITFITALVCPAGMVAVPEFAV